MKEGAAIDVKTVFAAFAVRFGLNFASRPTCLDSLRYFWGKLLFKFREGSNNTPRYLYDLVKFISVLITYTNNGREVRSLALVPKNIDSVFPTLSVRYISNVFV